MRKHPTGAEKILWNALSCGWFKEARFRRQAVILGYIADFYCPKALLVVEVDGDSHDNRSVWDKNRDSAMSCRGLWVIRFTNDDVYKRIGKVLGKIRGIAECRIRARQKGLLHLVRSDDKARTIKAIESEDWQY